MSERMSPEKVREQNKATWKSLGFLNKLRKVATDQLAMFGVSRATDVGAVIGGAGLATAALGNPAGLLFAPAAIVGPSFEHELAARNAGKFEKNIWRGLSAALPLSIATLMIGLSNPALAPLIVPGSIGAGASSIGLLISRTFIARHRKI